MDSPIQIVTSPITIREALVDQTMESVVLAHRLIRFTVNEDQSMVVTWLIQQPGGKFKERTVPVSDAVTAAAKKDAILSAFVDAVAQDTLTRAIEAP